MKHRYIILWGNTLNDLDSLVENYLDHGWLLQGSPFVAPGSMTEQYWVKEQASSAEQVIAQAMHKPNGEENGK